MRLKGEWRSCGKTKWRRVELEEKTERRVKLEEKTERKVKFEEKTERT